MRVVVQKYGGSSVTDVDRIRGVADRIAATAADGTRVVVVVSAMGNTTNELLALARSVSRAPDRRELDMLLSVGERISMALVAMALRDRGVPARSLTGSQSGIITDEAHAGARVVEVRADRVRRHLEGGEVVIVAGFQGVSREREVTTLGRGGSDTTAVVLAAALGAEYCEICSDVDGVWTADPRVVADARRLDALSLDEALALARGGARVLYEQAVQYARDHGVAIHASAAFGPGAGTRIAASSPTRGAVVAVTADADLRRLRVTGALADLAAALDSAGARVRRILDDRLWVDVRNVHAALAPAGAIDEGPTAMVTAVGSGLGERADVLAEGSRALAELASRRGGAADALWWEVAPQRVDDAVRLVHAALVGQ